ncbi:MAG TPA: 4-hydroxy-tetrahydrodipicolinate reductase [Steroidobacteraceae bacterium]
MSEHPLRIAILGATGRMGAVLLRAIDELTNATLVGATASATSRWLGQDAGAPGAGAARGVAITSNAADAVRGANVAIDFTLPEATLGNLEACAAAGCPLVIGTTGYGPDVRAHIERTAAKIPIVAAANMSVGVNLLIGLTQLAAQALDATYDIEIFEAHHRNKKDAPSGTALALGEAAAQGRGISLNKAAVFDRHGMSGPRPSGAIGFSVFRGGDVIGDHTVTFAGIGERIELTHRASDRMTFARGAMRAAQWIVGRSPGLYSMQDVLGLKRASA